MPAVFLSAAIRPQSSQIPPPALRRIMLSIVAEKAQQFCTLSANLPDELNRGRL
jgi:hypothetical protein